MNFFSGKKISEENKNLLEICKSKEKAINMLTELTQTLKSENTELNKQLTEQLHIIDELTTTNNHVSGLYEKLKEKYKKLEDERDIVSVNELTFMNDNLRKERDELLIDKDKLINELAIYKSMFGHIQDIVKDYGNAILEVKKFNPDQIEYDKDVKHPEYITELYDTGEDRDEDAEYLKDLSNSYVTKEEFDELLSNTPTREGGMKAQQCENMITSVQHGLMPEGSDLVEITTTGVLEVMGNANALNEDGKKIPLDDLNAIIENDQNEDLELVKIRKIRKITKSNYDVLECIDKRTVYIIVQNKDEEETLCFDEPAFAKIIKSYCDAKEDGVKEVDNPFLDGPCSDVW